MERKDNYAIAAKNAKALFLGFDQQALIRKLHLSYTDDYLFTTFLGAPYRISRATGDMERKKGETWVDGNSFDEVLTILDLLCCSREDRAPSRRYKNMTDFGLQFHRSLLESREPLADFAQQRPQAFREAVIKLGGREIPGADLSFAVPVFEELELVLRFWFGDEEFAPRMRFLWDENSLQYLKYETMHYLLGVLRQRLKEN